MLEYLRYLLQNHLTLNDIFENNKYKNVAGIILIKYKNL